MKVLLQIPDTVHDAYIRHAEKLQGAGGSASAEDLMIQHLERYKDVPPHDRIVVVESRARQRLEDILQGGALRDSADLIQKVEHLASLQIGQIKVDFTPAQWTELKNRALRNNRTVYQIVEATVRDMEILFFDHVSG